jgi:hypothetical protein
MKTLLTAAIVLTLSGAAVAQSEVPEDTIPGYSTMVQPASGQQLAINTENRSEPLEYSVPGYGVTSTTGRIFSQTAIGSSGYDYLGYEFEGNQ